jgi:hypothetical protein
VDRGPRYAIYFVPAPDSAVYRFGSAVLGYDCYTGGAVARPAELEGNAEDWEKLTAEPRQYGFHATLKSPFWLSSACTEAQLVSAVNSFAGLGHAAPELSPTIQNLEGFIAIVSRQRVPPVDALASHCTTLFDAFRAPMSPHERRRRVAMGLSHSQVQNLDRWGYPYLFGDFRFHMTLTGLVGAERREVTLAALRQCFQRMRADQTIRIDRLALVRQDTRQERFRVLVSVGLRAAG